MLLHTDRDREKKYLKPSLESPFRQTTNASELRDISNETVLGSTCYSNNQYFTSRSHWSHSLRRGSAATRLLG